MRRCGLSTWINLRWNGSIFSALTSWKRTWRPANVPQRSLNDCFLWNKAGRTWLLIIGNVVYDWHKKIVASNLLIWNLVDSRLHRTKRCPAKVGAAARFTLLVASNLSWTKGCKNHRATQMWVLNDSWLIQSNLVLVYIHVQPFYQTAMFQRSDFIIVRI